MCWLNNRALRHANRNIPTVVTSRHRSRHPCRSRLQGNLSATGRVCKIRWTSKISVSSGRRRFDHRRDANPEARPFTASGGAAPGLRGRGSGPGKGRSSGPRPGDGPPRLDLRPGPRPHHLYPARRQPAGPDGPREGSRAGPGRGAVAIRPGWPRGYPDPPQPPPSPSSSRSLIPGRTSRSVAPPLMSLLDTDPGRGTP